MSSPDFAMFMRMISDPAPQRTLTTASLCSRI
jgi:hypothetical protein